MTKYFQSANGLWMPKDFPNIRLNAEYGPWIAERPTPFRDDNQLLYLKYGLSVFQMYDPLPRVPVYHYEEDENWLRQERYKNGWNRMWKRQMTKNVRRALEKLLRMHKEYQELIRVCREYERKRNNTTV